MSYMDQKEIGPNPPIHRPLQRLPSSPHVNAIFSSTGTTLQAIQYPPGASYPQKQPVSKSVSTTPPDSPLPTNSMMRPNPFDSVMSPYQTDSKSLPNPINQDYPPPYSSSNSIPPIVTTPPPYSTVPQQ